MIVFKCELCEQIDNSVMTMFSEPMEKYCSECAKALGELEQETHKRVMGHMYSIYDKAVQNRVAILEFCAFILDHNKSAFEATFGEEGLNLLKKVVF